MNNMPGGILECSSPNEEKKEPNVQVEVLEGHSSMFDCFKNGPKSETNNKYLCFDF